ncbi:MAG: GAF domain-containing protein [Candidatus Sulfotelmatobacter sp.]
MTDHGSFGSGSGAPTRAEKANPEAKRSTTASVSAGIAVANANLPSLTEPHAALSGPCFPAEDGGRSLAAMAERDLDATLQLLAERAQYITGASGAAIALRRGQHKDMLCRASTGPNAPELGALLSMEYGLSGESVRTLQILRCDDTERDPRVNKEGCRQLGIASVVVMPVVCEDRAIGVFELFSGKPNVFGERDVSALRRLSEMVEAAVKHATAMRNVAAGAPVVGLSETWPLSAARNSEIPVEGATIEKHSELERASSATGPPLPSESIATDLHAQEAQADAPAVESTEPQSAEPCETHPAPTKKPVFWSAAVQKSESPPAMPSTFDPAVIAVPAVLRNLQKCSACGFPVSQGRSLCVECEQKKWRGEPLAQPAMAQAPQIETQDQMRQEAAVTAVPATVQAEEAQPVNNSEAATSTEVVVPDALAELPGPEVGAATTDSVTEQVPQLPYAEPSENSAMFLGSAMQSESWLAANKYVLAVLLVVALVIAAMVLLR